MFVSSILPYCPCCAAAVSAASRPHHTQLMLLRSAGFGYSYPALMDATDQAAFANATVHAAKRLGMGGYVHWDFVGDFLDPYFPVELGKNKGAGALSFLEQAGKAWGEGGVALLGGPSAAGPSPLIPSRVEPGGLTVVKPPSVLRGEWALAWQRNYPAANMSASLQALPRGTITYHLR